MLLILLMLGAVDARTCYPSTTTRTPYNVLDRATVETKRGCEVLCDASNETCAGFSFQDAGFTSSCVLLSVNTANEICSAETTIFLKQTTGCPDRSNITAEFGVDPCIDSFVPITQALKQYQICPQDKANLYVIRAITDDGKRISLDNDRNNWLEWNGEMWVYRYNWRGRTVATPIVAAVCAVAGAEKCPCTVYDRITDIEISPNYAALPNTLGPCAYAPAWLYWKLVKVPEIDYLDPANTALTSVTCHAGMWIIWREVDYNSFGVAGLSCYHQ